MLIGYMRPYEKDSNFKNQLIALNEANCEIIISEEHSLAKKRLQLDNMLKNLKKNDTIVVAKLFALADSTRHLVEILEILDLKGAYLYSISEEINTKNNVGSNFSDIVKHLVKFQSDVISEKTKKGLCEAKEKGITAGRPRKSNENVKRAILMYQSKKYTLAEIKNETGISKSTLYRYLEQ